MKYGLFECKIRSTLLSGTVGALDILNGKIAVSLLGNFKVIAADGRSLRPRGKKPAALFAYLLYNSDRDITRERLADLLWSDRGPKQSQDSLRQALHAIKSAIGPGGDTAIVATRTTVRIDIAGFGFDLWREDGSVVETNADQFLNDMDFIAPVFDEWLLATRTHTLNQRISHAERMLAETDPSTDDDRALALSSAILALDPINEIAARVAMRIYAGRGLNGHMKRVFEDLRQSLQADDLDISAKSQALFDDLSTDGTARSVAAVVTNDAAMPGDAPFDVPMLKILTRQPPSGTRTKAKMRAAVIDQLTARLVQVQELKVFADPSRGSAGAGQFQLAVNFEEHGGDSWATLSLQADLGETIFSCRIDLPDTIANTEIGVRVDGAVTQILPNLEMHLARKLDRTPRNAYEYYLTAKRYFLTASTEDYIDEVVSNLHKSIELNPDFLPAYSKLIMCYNTGMFMTRPGAEHGDMRERAFELAQRLVFVDSSFANAHISMSWCLIWKKRYASAERSIRRAIQLAPYDPHRLNVIGTTLLYLGYADECETFYHLAQDRMSHDMDFQRSDFGEMHYLKQEFDVALSWLEVPEVRTPYRALFWRAAANAQLGNLVEARRDLDELVTDLGKRWRGAEAFTPEAGVQWYVDMVPLRRQIDHDTMVDGLNKAGIRVR